MYLSIYVSIYLSIYIHIIHINLHFVLIYAILFQASGPHPRARIFDATASALSTLRQTTATPAAALAGTPLVLVNCTDQEPLASWQT